jgi:hypothetical protein
MTHPFRGEEIYLIVARDADNYHRPVTWRTTKAECQEYIAVLDAQRLDADEKLKPWREREHAARLACHDPTQRRYDGDGGPRYPETHPSHAEYERFLIDYREFRETLRLTLLDHRVLGWPSDRSSDSLWYHEEYEIWQVPPDPWPYLAEERRHQRALLRQPIRFGE